MKSEIRVLIVEDDPMTALTIEENLSEDGFIICGKAFDYESAIRLMKAESPDLALVDIALKNKPDGIETAHELKRIKPIPIVYLTGNTESETFQRAEKTNPAGFLHKPFRPKELSHQLKLATANFYQEGVGEIIHMPDHFYVSETTNKLRRINHAGIFYLNAEGAYSEIFLTQEEYLRHDLKKTYKDKASVVVSIGLGKILKRLPDQFYRISRSIVINLNYLNEIEPDRIRVGPYEIPLIEGSRKTLLEQLNIIRSREEL